MSSISPYVESWGVLSLCFPMSDAQLLPKKAYVRTDFPSTQWVIFPPPNVNALIRPHSGRWKAVAQKRISANEFHHFGWAVASEFDASTSGNVTIDAVWFMNFVHLPPKKLILSLRRREWWPLRWGNPKSCLSSRKRNTSKLWRRKWSSFAQRIRLCRSSCGASVTRWVGGQTQRLFQEEKPESLLYQFRSYGRRTEPCQKLRRVIAISNLHGMRDNE